LKEKTPTAPAAIPAPTEPLSLEIMKEKWASIIGDISEQKRSLWVALSETAPLAVDGDVVTIGFPRRSDAEMLKKPQGPGSPLPNADLLRDAIEAHTGHRVRFTVGDLVTAAAPAAGESTDADNGEEADSDTDSAAPAKEATKAENPENLEVTGEETDDETSEPEETPTPSSSDKRATRGEPVIREVFGGQLIGEEILDSMGDGEISV